MTTHAMEWARPPRRSTAFLLIVALHALVIYGFLSVFVPPKVQAPETPFVGRFFDPERPTPPAGPKRPRSNTTLGWTNTIPNPPVPLFSLDYTDPSSTVSSVSSGSPAGIGPVVPLSYVVTKPLNDYYPPGSIRFGEQGASTLQVCVGADGALVSEPTLATSSGFSRLDAAAVKWAREALRFTPAQRDGKAVPACKGFRVTFRINPDR
ncbi:MAG TPA: energy transducer TonB [Steroidobacteraceae bacterium]|nr:energy transducer TonB [Steroidobacteraceae bacterium]